MLNGTDLSVGADLIPQVERIGKYLLSQPDIVHEGSLSMPHWKKVR